MAAESKLETECREYIELAWDGMLVKTRLVARNGWPDRELLIPHCPVVYIEFKAPGKVPRKNQDRWRKWFLANGFQHWVIDDWEQFLDQVYQLTNREE